MAAEEIDTIPTRPALRWHGGKWRLAPWIIDHFPKHRIYVEPFGGAASVLIRKPRSYAEVYNDLDGEVVTLFRILRDPDTSADFCRRIALTPFAREEFEGSYHAAEDDIEIARRLVVRSFMGFGSDGHNSEIKTGFRSNSNRSGTTPAHDWMNLPASMALIARRFAGVVIESRPAMQVSLQHDGPETLHYLDPPYLPETRSQKSRRGKVRYHAYRHEMTVEDHAAFLDGARALAGIVVISGYPAPLYDNALKGWRRVEREALADGARARIEVLWLNRAAVDHLDHGPLFGGGG